MALAGFRTVASFARRAGLSPSYGSMIAKGLVPPLAKRLSIAAALGVPVDSIWKALP